MVAKGVSDLSPSAVFGRNPTKATRAKTEAVLNFGWCQQT